MSSSEVVTARTDAGMLALWSTSSFADVDGYEAWETQVEDRLADCIASGHLVPVNIRSDGAFGVRVTDAPEGLTDRERAYAVVTSAPYLLASSGSDVCLSGIEHVGDPQGAPARLRLTEGTYAVRVTVVDWAAEPGASGPDGHAGPTALPDFVVHIERAAGTEAFRRAEETFDPPS